MSVQQNEPTVSHVHEGKIQKPWGLGAFYRKDGAKLVLSRRVLGVLAGALFVTTSFYSLLCTEEEAAEISSSIAKMISIPALQASNPSDLTPTPSPTKNAASEDSRSNQTAEKSVKLPRLQVVTRPNVSGIPPGSLIKARLLSGASNGPVRAVVAEDLSIDGSQRLERGAILLGDGKSSEKRLFIRFSKIVHKGGEVEELSAQACDLSDQIVGLKGERVSGQLLKLAAGAALNFAGGVSEGLQDKESQGGIERRPPTLKNAVLNGAAHAALDQARDIMSGQKAEPIVIEVSAGTVFYAISG